MNRTIARLLWAAAALAAPTWATPALAASSTEASALVVTQAARAVSAETELLELGVQGLNCTLCSDAMKAKLMQMAGAHDIEPQVECGRIYLEVDRGAKVAPGPISLVLMANGFNFKGIKPAEQSMAQVREAAAKGAC